MANHNKSSKSFLNAARFHNRPIDHRPADYLAMGYYNKRELEQGLKPIHGKYVCYHCFDDYSIKEFISSNAVARVCNYCGRKCSKPIAAKIDDVVDLIYEGICYEYEDAVENVAYESSEGGYQLPTMVTMELIEEVFEDEDLNAGLRDDLITALPDANWIHINPYSLPEGERLRIDWERFCRQVKHETRYMFFKLSTQNKKQLYEDNSEPYKILFRLGEIVKSIGLVKSIPAGSNFFRVRCHGSAHVFRNANDLGPPPVESAKYSNRMSPAGISMFYGALDLSTAIKETYDHAEMGSCIITKARFETLIPMKILDLTSLPRYSSLFDEEQRYLRPAFSFIRAFISDVIKPICKDEREHIEYVPTQVVTEYFRHVYRDDQRNTINGIFYPSSRNIGGVSCVIFCDSQKCIDSANSTETDEDKWLVMKNESVRRLRSDVYISGPLAGKE